MTRSKEVRAPGMAAQAWHPPRSSPSDGPLQCCELVGSWSSESLGPVSFVVGLESPAAEASLSPAGAVGALASLLGPPSVFGAASPPSTPASAEPLMCGGVPAVLRM